MNRLALLALLPLASCAAPPSRSSDAAPPAAASPPVANAERRESSQLPEGITQEAEMAGRAYARCLGETARRFARTTQESATVIADAAHGTCSPHLHPVPPRFATLARTELRASAIAETVRVRSEAAEQRNDTPEMAQVRTAAHAYGACLVNSVTRSAPVSAAPVSAIADMAQVECAEMLQRIPAGLRSSLSERVYPAVLEEARRARERANAAPPPPSQGGPSEPGRAASAHRT